MTPPILLSTWSFALAANRAAWPSLATGGTSLEAVEAVCRHIEDDTSVDSVGLGGLPDASGRVTLDASVMLSPSQSGSICALSTHAHATSIARAVLEHSPHRLLAGPGAERFAAEHNIHPQELLTPQARATYEAWLVDKNSVGPQNIDPLHEQHHDTVGCLALDSNGVLAGACSTSGMRFKTPGRVGDSPIPGHGLWVHPEHGACVATGTGELMMGSSTAFLAVERMRAGASPTEALIAAIERTAEEQTLAPEDQIALLALRPDGSYAVFALRPGFRAVLSIGPEPELLDPRSVLGDPDPGES
jgi:isoaspartyl peptidase/L-asparaginase-like protein (Ntn-hydrolase superfamily)